MSVSVSVSVSRSRTLVALTIAWLSMVCLLPVETFCDTSYYEKYYAARRYVPLKRNAPLLFNFTLTLTDSDTAQLAAHERPALVGNLPVLGGWQASGALLLNRTAIYNVWSGSVEIPQNSSVEYRYFAAAVGHSGSVQVRRWESHVLPRSFNVTKLPGNRSDEFGVISGQRQLTRGWLQASGNIVQLKVFRDALRLEEDPDAGRGTLRLRVQPVDPASLSPILSSARANVEYVRMAFANSKLRDQPAYGVPYAAQDILMYHATLDDVEQVAFLVEVYAEQPAEDLVRLLGYAHLQPTSLNGSEGSVTLSLISPLWQRVVGELRLEYLLIRPMASNQTFDMRTSFAHYWRGNWTGLEIGHRGLGKSLTVTSNAAPLIENTLASMLASVELGADLVEFDVQLTSDLVPIIHHDWSIHVCIHPKTPKSRDDLTEVLLKDITYEQLKELKTYQIVGSKIVEYPAHNNVEQLEQRLFPTLQDFFERVNQTVGLDIEIKWPQEKRNGVYESEQTIDKNLYVDRILEVLHQHGCGRLNVLKSFDVDLCSLLRFKQNMYPVLVLSSSTNDYYADPRTSTVETINFAQAFDLAGIVPNTVPIKANPALVQSAKEQVPLVLVWGADLKDRASIDTFIQMGVTGVIYDRMDLWLGPNQTSAFESEQDLPDFFQLQCEPVPEKRVVNATIESILSNVNFL